MPRWTPNQTKPNQTKPNQRKNNARTTLILYFMNADKSTLNTTRTSEFVSTGVTLQTSLMTNRDGSFDVGVSGTNINDGGVLQIKRV